MAILFVAASVRTATAGGALAPTERQEPTTETEHSCLLAGYRPGMIITNLRDKKLFTKGEPKVYKTTSGVLYELTRTDGPYRQYVSVVRDRVYQVIREYDWDLAQKVYAALLDRYGRPVVDSASPTIRGEPTTGVAQVVGTLWRDVGCGYDVQLIIRNELGTPEKVPPEAVAIVFTETTAARGGQESPLLK